MWRRGGQRLSQLHPHSTGQRRPAGPLVVLTEKCATFISMVPMCLALKTHKAPMPMAFRELSTSSRTCLQCGTVSTLSFSWHEVLQLRLVLQQVVSSGCSATVSVALKY